MLSPESLGDKDCNIMCSSPGRALKHVVFLFNIQSLRVEALLIGVGGLLRADKITSYHDITIAKRGGSSSSVIEGNILRVMRT